MPTYLSILRGINVGAQKKILMADLKKLYDGLGFDSVTTYIQSGNVLFKTKKTPPAALVKKIEAAIKTKYGFDVPVIIRETEEMENVCQSNPFLKRKDVQMERLHVTFLAAVPEAALTKDLEKFTAPKDEFVIAGKEVYLYTPGGYGETKLSNTFFEKKLKVTATTRNWKSVCTLAEMAAKL